MGALAIERQIKMSLLASCYLPKNQNDTELQGNPLHISDARLWPTGFVLSQRHTKFLQMKTETQFQVVSAADA